MQCSCSRYTSLTKLLLIKYYLFCTLGHFAILVYGTDDLKVTIPFKK